MNEIALRFFNEHQGMVPETGRHFIKPAMGINTGIKKAQANGWKVMIWLEEEDYTGERIFTGDYLEHRETGAILFVNSVNALPQYQGDLWIIIGNCFQNPELKARYLDQSVQEAGPEREGDPDA